MCSTEDIIRYLLSKTGGMSTFRLSRTLLLFDLEWNRLKGGKKTGIHYVLYPSAFYIEEFPDMLENMGDVEKVIIENEGGKKGIFRLKEKKEVSISEDVREMLDRILSETESMDDHSLNQYVVSREDYKKLL